jgi:hypothetical protein
MRLLFLTVNREDYLSDSILHGLREILGASVVDYPKKDCLYTSHHQKQPIYGNGFTLYKTLDDIDIDRTRISDKICRDYFDYIFFSDISEQFGYLLTYYNYINRNKIVIIDGNDSPKIFPFFGKYWRKFPYMFLPSFQNKSYIFKREWTPLTLKYRSYLLLPNFVCSKFYQNLNIHKISFSIPNIKIVKEVPLKSKLFGYHIVDPEIIEKHNYGEAHYAFDNEEDYYKDLQISRFGITTKRAGWDCMRHYEIAANGAVPCFRDLDLKPHYCAPHDLTPGINCINYHSYEDLIEKINSIDEFNYKHMQINAMDWVRTKTTKNIASYILDTVNYKSINSNAKKRGDENHSI